MSLNTFWTMIRPIAVLSTRWGYYKLKSAKLFAILTSMRSLAHKHKVSAATVSNIVNGLEKNLEVIINKKVNAEQEIAKNKLLQADNVNIKNISYKEYSVSSKIAGLIYLVFVYNKIFP